MEVKMSVWYVVKVNLNDPEDVTYISGPHHYDDAFEASRERNYDSLVGKPYDIAAQVIEVTV